MESTMTFGCLRKDIKLIRGDTVKLKIRRHDANGDPILVPAQKLFMTVKTQYSAKNVILQKTIDDMFFTPDGFYHITINPEDTDGLPYGEYVYDIEIVIDDYKKTVCKGTLILDTEATHAGDEV